MPAAIQPANKGKNEFDSEQRERKKGPEAERNPSPAFTKNWANQGGSRKLSIRWCGIASVRLVRRCCGRTSFVSSSPRDAIVAADVNPPPPPPPNEWVAKVSPGICTGSRLGQQKTFHQQHFSRFTRKYLNRLPPTHHRFREDCHSLEFISTQIPLTDIFPENSHLIRIPPETN